MSSSHVPNLDDPPTVWRRCFSVRYISAMSISSSNKCSISSPTCETNPNSQNDKHIQDWKYLKTKERWWILHEHYYIERKKGPWLSNMDRAREYVTSIYYCLLSNISETTKSNSNIQKIFMYAMTYQLPIKISMKQILESYSTNRIWIWLTNLWKVSLSRWEINHNEEL